MLPTNYAYRPHNVNSRSYNFPAAHSDIPTVLCKIENLNFYQTHTQAAYQDDSINDNQCYNIPNQMNYVENNAEIVKSYPVRTEDYVDDGYPHMETSAHEVTLSEVEHLKVFNRNRDSMVLSLEFSDGESIKSDVFMMTSCTHVAIVVNTKDDRL